MRFGLKSDLNYNTGATLIEFADNKYIATNGTTVDVNNPTTHNVWMCAVVDCSEGDVFTVNGYGGSAPRIWCFIDSNNTVLSAASASASFFGTLTAPANAAKLIINKIKGQRIDAPCFIGKVANSRLEYLEDNTIIARPIDDNLDLNNFTTPGIYILTGAATYTNAPEEITTGGKHLFVYKTYNTNYLMQRLYWTGANNTIPTFREYIRIRNTSTNWYDWKLVYNQADIEELKDTVIKQDNTILTYTNDTYSTGNPYNGTKLRFLSYNVAQFDNDTSIHISDEKIFNFRKMLSEIQPDFIALQEDQYLDGSTAEAQTSVARIFSPVYPISLGTTICTIKTKINPLTNYGIMYYDTTNTTVGWLRAAIFNVEGKKILICSTHLIANYNQTGMDSEESKAARELQYTRLFQWIHGEIALRQVTENVTKTCDPSAWDYCIICGDMNSSTDDDKATLKTLASARNFKLANGGWLGWLETRRSASGVLRASLDNIIVSENVVISSIRACKSMYFDLYSDHYPFVADVILTD